MRGRDQPHVGADGLIAADALERLLLEQPEDLGLEGQRHVADLVEKKGSPVALLELADAAPVGSGEGALLVPEQLAFQQILGDGGAIQRQERHLGSGAVSIDGTGDQFLAGAALAGDEYGDILGGDTADGLVHLLHGRAEADHPALGVRVWDGFLCRGRLAHVAGRVQRLSDDPPHHGPIRGAATGSHRRLASSPR